MDSIQSIIQKGKGGKINKINITSLNVTNIPFQVNATIKIAEAISDNSISAVDNKIAGTVIDDNLTILCEEGILIPTKLQRSGKSLISKEDFLRGFKIPKGAVLE